MKQLFALSLLLIFLAGCTTTGTTTLNESCNTNDECVWLPIDCCAQEYGCFNVNYSPPLCEQAASCKPPNEPPADKLCQCIKGKCASIMD